MSTNDDTKMIVGLVKGESLYIPWHWSYSTVSMNRSVAMEFRLKNAVSRKPVATQHVLTYAYPPPLHVIREALPLKIQGLTTQWKHLSQWENDNTLYPLFHAKREIINVFIPSLSPLPFSSRINILLGSKTAWHCNALNTKLSQYKIPYPTEMSSFQYEPGYKDAFDRRLKTSATQDLIVTVIGGTRQVFLSR